MTVLKQIPREFWRQQAVAKAFASQGEGRPASEGLKSICLHVIRLTGAKRPRVLDVGCGSGDLSVHLPRTAVAGYTGIDVSDEMLELARKRFPRRTFVRGDLMSFCHRVRAKADAFFAINCLQYVKRGEMCTALSNLRASVRKGGIGYIEVSAGHGKKLIGMGNLRTESYNWTPETLLPELWENRFSLLAFEYGPYYLGGKNSFCRVIVQAI